MTILLFVAVLVVLIVVHELGHFAAAKWLGIRVDEFGVGFPPKVFGIKRGETEYTLNALPIGGFVRIYGEDPDAVNTEDPDYKRSFVTAPKWAQAIVLVAGVSMNILLAWLLFIGAFMMGIPAQVDESEVERLDGARLLVTTVMPDTPADEVLEANDIVTAVSAGGTTLSSPVLPSELINLVAEHEGEAVRFEVIRRGEPETFTVVPERGVVEEDPERAATGFAMTLTGIERVGFFEAIYRGTIMTYNSLEAIVVGFATLIYEAVRGTADFSAVSGPVGIVDLVGDAASLGVVWLVTFTAFISLNLAVLNLLPFPALDGGRLLFVIIEKVKGSPIKPEVAGWANRIGFGLLLLLMLVVTVKDVMGLLD